MAYTVDSSPTGAMPNLRFQKPLRQLYDEDFGRWAEATVTCLRARDTQQLDWEGLIKDASPLTLHRPHENFAG